MKRVWLVFTLGVWILTGAATSARAAQPSDPPAETTRGTALKAVYFPFLALGHGLMLVGKYGVAYPIWFLAKPLYDTVYESSEDPEDLATGFPSD